jgi:hypothetical protein
MERKFKAKVEGWLIALIVFGAITSLTILIGLGITRPEERDVFLLSGLLIILGDTIAIYLITHTVYLIDSRNIKIYFGPLKVANIRINEIQRVELIDGIFGKGWRDRAISFSRIAIKITLNNSKSYIISPENRISFLEHLYSFRPDLREYQERPQ